MPPLFFRVLTALLLALTVPAAAQVGISSSPARLYYQVPAGGQATQKIAIDNPTNRRLEVGVSVGDWRYDTLGNNVFLDAGQDPASCVNWMELPGGNYYVLQPNEHREIDVAINVPAGAATTPPVHVAMLYLTQLNSMDGSSQSGASLKVTVRMATKIYHSFSRAEIPSLEIDTLTRLRVADTGSRGGTTSYLKLALKNTGNLWADGDARMELLDNRTNKKTALESIPFYTLPGDYRVLTAPIPKNLPPGHYTATALVQYKGSDAVELAEVELDL